MIVCQHFCVIGKVQGVCYRAFAQAEANNLRLTGWVRNLSDGRVELLACGEATQLARLQSRLKQGPPHAQVNELQVSDHRFEHHSRFVILPSQ